MVVPEGFAPSLLTNRVSRLLLSMGPLAAQLGLAPRVCRFRADYVSITPLSKHSYPYSTVRLSAGKNHCSQLLVPT